MAGWKKACDVCQVAWGGGETPALAGSINLVGARIDDITLTKYRQTIKKDSPPVRLFAPGGTKAAYFASIGWSAQGIQVPGPTTLWTATGSKLTPTTPVTLPKRAAASLPESS